MDQPANVPPKRSRRLTQSSPSSRHLAVAKVEEPKKRRRKPVVVAVLVALGVVVGYLASGLVSKKARAPLAALAPEPTVLWVEAEKPAATLEAWRASPGWKEFAASGTCAEVQRLWNDLAAKDAASPRSIAKALGLPLDERTLLLLGGEGVALGVYRPEGGKASRIFMTEVDTTGLLKALAAQGEWSQLWDRLAHALGSGEGVESYKGFSIEKESGGSGFFARLGSTLVRTDTIEAMRAVIDVKKGDAPSLASGPRLARELDALPEVAVFAWGDAAFARDPARAAAALAPFGEVKTEHCEVIASELRDQLDAVAVGLAFPTHEIAEPRLCSSRGEAEVFRDVRPRDASALVPESVVSVRLQGLEALVDRAASSGIAAALARSEGAAWLGEVSANPGASGFAAKSAGRPLDHDLAFEVRLYRGALGALVHELLSGEAALAVEPPQGEKPGSSRSTLVLRAGPVARILVDALSGLAGAQASEAAFPPAPDPRHRRRAAPPTFRAGTRGEHHYAGFGNEGFILFWAAVGPHVIVTTDEQEIQFAVDRAERPTTGRATGADEALAGLPAGWTAAAFVDLDRYHSEGKVATALYAAQDFSTLTARTLETWDPARSKQYLGRTKEPLHGLDSLPPEAIFAAALEIDAKAAYEDFLANLRVGSGEKRVTELTDDFTATLEKSPDEVLAQLGTSVGFSLVPQDRLVPKDFGPETARGVLAVPALVGAWALRTPAGVEESAVKLAKRYVRSWNDSVQGAKDEARRSSGRPVAASLLELRSEPVGNTTVYRFAVDGDEETRRYGAGFEPCFAVSGSWLYVATSRAALRRAVDAAKGKNLASAPELASALHGLPAERGAFSYLSFPALAAQFEKDADVLARDYAPPPPRLGRPPAAPELLLDEKDMKSEDDFQRAFAEYQEHYKAYVRAYTAWSQEIARYRAENADANSKIVLHFLRTLRLLGTVGGTSAPRADGVESLSVLRFDIPK